MCKLSVIVPVYNSEQYLSKCLHSILSQTEASLEVVLIDDGSTDKSGSICRQLAAADKRVKYFYQENSGVSSARNEGIRQANGEFLMFVDSDDMLAPDSIRLFLAEAEQGFDFVMGGYAQFNEDKCLLENRAKAFKGDIKAFLEQVDAYLEPPCLLGPCFKLFKKSILSEYSDIQFPVDMSYGEDVVFVFRYLQHTKTVSCIDFITYWNQKANQNSLSNRFRTDKLEINLYLAALLKELLEKHHCHNAAHSFCRTCVRYFDSFTTELLTSDLSYQEKKECFYENAAQFEILKYYEKMNALSRASKLRKKAIGSRAAYLLMSFLYRLKR